MYDYNIKKEKNKIILDINIPPRRFEPLVIVDLREVKKILASSGININEYDAISGRVITNDIPPYDTTWIFNKKQKSIPKRLKKLDKPVKPVLLSDSNKNITKNDKS
tara:strand:+ start:228 stop:548 length:321 start_codon:yes stop_codon:yes gene_type:complete